MKLRFILILLVVALGIIPRCRYFNRPLWIDEIKQLQITENVRENGYSELITHHHGRELLSVTINYIFGLHDKQARIPVILFSLLSITIPPLILRNKYSIYISLMLAFGPIFTFWGTLARPYAIGMFFCLLGYRWKWFYIPALMATPFSITGLNMFHMKHSKIFYSILIITSIVWWKFYPAGGDHFNVEFISNAKRLWIIPISIVLVYFADDRTIQGIRKVYKRLVKSKSKS